MTTAYKPGDFAALKLAQPLVARWEGCVLVAYLCPAGVWTIGYGHTGPDVYEGLRITQERADELLRRDLEVAQRIVRKYTRVALNASQEAALISFVFNLGMARFSGSTLLRLLNKGDYAQVPTQLMRWTKATVKGKLVDLQGLIDRRKAEGLLWRSGK